MSVHGDHEHGAAWRRRQRRLRMHWRHEQLTLQMLLATYEHHATPRRHEGQERRVGTSQHHTATFRSIPPPRRQALCTFPWTSKMCLPPGRGLTASLASGPQERVQQHPADQIVDTAPALPILDVPLPLMGEQLGGRPPFLRYAVSCCREGYRRAQDLSGGHPCPTLVSRAAAGGTVGGSANYPELS